MTPPAAAPPTTSILELPSIRRHASPLSVEEYHRLSEFNENGRRTELLRGFIIEKISKSPRHAFLLLRLLEIIRAALDAGRHARPEQPLTLVDSEPEPDIAVVAGDLGDYADAHPATALLVIEIAFTSEELDRAKAVLYAEAGIAEYWLVLPARGLIEVHTVPRDGLYTHRQVFARGETLASTTLPSLRVELAQLFGA
ncbi:MAG: Uma2 family endonuclease [Verrucomicrobia bacterium]|nr:Uma2 family endonuclease [Verrucomicrobiota bacterium]